VCVCVDFSFLLIPFLFYFFVFFQACRGNNEDLHYSPPRRSLIILAAKLFVKMPKNPQPSYNNGTKNDVVSDDNNGHTATFPSMYSVAESIARNVRDAVQYLHEEEIMELNLDGDGSDGDNLNEENDEVTGSK
jgi:hypothetical protein